MKSFVLVVACLAGCAGNPPPQPDPPAPLPPAPVASAAPSAAPRPAERVVTTASGLEYIDLKVGDGPSPASEDSSVTVQYTGWLADGTKFDSSYDHGGPMTLPLKHLIQGWREGVLTMHVGGKRRLIIPPELGYGSRARVGKIPANATLTFDIELLGVRDASP